MSFNIGLSGIRAANSDLNVTGNNIANAGTVGFKQSRAEFQDIYAASVLGTGSNPQGSGVLLGAVSQLHNQGTIDYTENALDMAINGNGFFVTSNNGAISYTRAGYFGTDKDGFVVDNNGYRLQGYSVDENGQLQAGVMSDLRIESASQAPQATSKITQPFNLNSTLKVPTTVPFDPTDPTSYNSGTSLDIYDSQGNAHVMSQYFVKTGPNTWQMNVLIDGRNPGNPGDDAAAISAAETAAATATTAQQVADAVAASGASADAIANAQAAATATGATVASVLASVQGFGSSPYKVNLTFDSSGQLASQVPVADGSGDGFTYDATTGLLTIAAADWVPAAQENGEWVANGASGNTAGMAMDLRGSTQYSSTFAITSRAQDGYTTGQLSGLEIDDTGNVFARYTNGQSRVQGQVVLANFANVQGLTPIGKTSWVQSSDSGEPVIGTPRSGTLGALQAGALEASNVDLSTQLVNLIVAQRNYQANAKTIETENAVTQTIINLR